MRTECTRGPTLETVYNQFCFVSKIYPQKDPDKGTLSCTASLNVDMPFKEIKSSIFDDSKITQLLHLDKNQDKVITWFYGLNRRMDG